MKLNKIFTSHMVFPRNLPIRIYGEGFGEVEILFAGHKKKTVSHENNWMVEFPAMEYGGPYAMTVIFEDDTIVLRDIYIGEVFLFAGQSNMQFKMKDSNAPMEMYNSNDKLRIYSTDRIEKNDYYTSDDGWVICNKETVGELSAIAYPVGNEISKNKNIAVGIITCYQGASVIESWVPEKTFEKMNICIPVENKFEDHTNEEFSKWNRDGVLYSFALSQVMPFPLSGVVWYQGESDASEEEGRVYCNELCALINIWRKDFLNEKLPFVVIQIADCVSRAGKGWSLIQKAQEEVQSRLLNVKTVISADVCENDEIHPKTKHKLAQRVAEVICSNYIK